MQSEIKLPWSDWKIVRRLGGGSFGSVYEIERDLLGTTEHAAVKIITVPHDMSEYNELSASGFDLESINSRFYADLGDIANEYSLMAALKGNANIIHCEDIQYQKNENGIGYSLFIRMELLRTMTEVIGTQPDDVTVIKVGTDLCNALSACRRHNIIHRDIKPGNILIARDGTCKLGDFGVSKTTDRTAGGTKTGTYGFMAPEVYNSRPYNAGVDIYSLGMVLYWMLNRRTGPFLPLPPQLPSAREVDEAKQKRFSGTPLPPPADGSEALRQVVLKATAYDPAARFQTPEEFAAALRAAAPGQAPKTAASVSASQKAAAPAPSAASEEATVGNNWGYTDEATQGSVGASGYDSGATVGATSYADDRAAAQRQAAAKNGQPVRVSGDLDIVTSLALTPEEAAQGCRKRVTVNGKSYDITVPAGSREGLALRINGRGKEDPATGARGNLLVRLHIRAAEAAADFWGKKAEPGCAAQFVGAITVDEALKSGGKTYKYKKKKYKIPFDAQDGTAVDGLRFYFLPKNYALLADEQKWQKELDTCSEFALRKYAAWDTSERSSNVRGESWGAFISLVIALAVTIATSGGGFATLLFPILMCLSKSNQTRMLNAELKMRDEAAAALKRRFGEALKYSKLIAPMPGKITEITAAVGARVSRADTVCKLFAIGRENNMIAGESGTVCEICVKPGDTVAKGDLLAVIQTE
ncbi:MAG: protein kinase [Oscillospiraceae bacterium]|nr:protein kinase [Oscillospiraceae bacterium]